MCPFIPPGLRFFGFCGVLVLGSVALLADAPTIHTKADESPVPLKRSCRTFQKRSASKQSPRGFPEWCR